MNNHFTALSTMFNRVLVVLKYAPLIGALVACTPSEIHPRSSVDKMKQLERKDYRIFLKNHGKEVKISYLVAGDPNGRRVVFIHGTPGEAKTSWADFLIDVPSGYEYVALDRPGFAESGPSGPITSFDDQVDAFLPLMEIRNNKKPIIVGHSMGATLAVLAAINYPDRVGGILVGAGALDPKLEEVMWIQHVGHAIQWIVPRALSNANEELLAYQSELEKFVEKMPEIAIPVTILHGTKDDLVPFENVKFMQEKMINAQPLTVDIIEGANHFLPWTYQDETKKSLNELFKIIELESP